MRYADSKNGLKGNKVSLMTDYIDINETSHFGTCMYTAVNLTIKC